MSESDDGDDLDDTRRAELLERVQRKTATIGQSIPDTVTIDGADFPLREFVWETKRTGHVPPDRREEVRRVRTKLQAERNRLHERLKNDALDTEEAETVARNIVGLDRAITALSNLYETNLAAESHDARLDDYRRWLSFIDQLSD
ncbi:MAG: DUF5788 family protein [Halobacteriota archaeon]